MNYEKFEPLLGSWGEHLRPFIESEECDKIYAKLQADSKAGRIITPEAKNTFRAFKETPFHNTKVVFLLQDPYPAVKEGVYTADGIAMSCRNTGKLQPSLEKFYEAVEEISKDTPSFRKNDLAYLCNQGCMMLNTALTVERDKIGSHEELWRPFTRFLLEDVFGRKRDEVIFVLCGEKSQYFARYINPLQHMIFEIEHPANAARKLRKWEHKDVFKRINKILESNRKTPIIWTDDLPF